MATPPRGDAPAGFRWVPRPYVCPTTLQAHFITNITLRGPTTIIDGARSALQIPFPPSTSNDSVAIRGRLRVLGALVADACGFGNRAAGRPRPLPFLNT